MADMFSLSSSMLKCRLLVGLLLLMVLVMESTYGYDSNTVDVHIVCHSHTDAGWYRTYESYYSSKVKKILNSVVSTLDSNSEYKFNWADTSFMARWYGDTSESNRQKLHKLIDNGQFKFMGGGWVMNDESLTDYRNVFLQLQTGIEWLEENLGVRPKVGWQIDPFGNAPVTPSLLSLLGYEGIVVNRIGTTLDHDLEISENSEFIWEGAQLDSEKSHILAHHLVGSDYNSQVEFKFQPENFPFWVHPRTNCTLEKLESNYEKCIKLYWDEVIHPSLTGHRHNKVLSVFGADFSFYDAAYSFKYIDKFIEVMRKHFKKVTGKDINIKYSSVEEYFEDVKNFNGGNISFPKYHADFLPYIELSDGTYDHWVGYYSSTPVLKHMIRDLFQKVRSVKVEFVLALAKQIKNHYGDLSNSIASINGQIKEIEQEASIMMHHDAITSTSPVGTLSDYMHRIQITNRKIDALSQQFTTALADPGHKATPSESSSLSGTKQISVTNPLPYARTEIANFTISQPYVKLYDSEGNPVKKAEVYQEYLAQYKVDGVNSAVNDYVVAFEINVPSFSQTLLFYKEVSEDECNSGGCVQIAELDVTNGGAEVAIENDYVRVEIKSGDMISMIKDKVSGEKVDLPTKFYAYPGTKGQTLSGLYVFNPIREAQNYALNVAQRYVQRGKIQTIVHSFYTLSGSRVTLAQSIAINTLSDEALRRSVHVTTKISTLEYGEYTMRTDLSSDFPKTTTEVYTDNSAETALRQFYSPEEAHDYNLTKTKYLEWVGVNGYATIHGTAFKTPSGKFFAFSNSNSLLMNALERNTYELILMRNTNYYDDKGITDALRDKNIETFDQIMFVAKDVDEYYTMKKKTSATLNSKLIVRVQSTVYNLDFDKQGYSIFGDLGITANYADVDFVDLKVIDKDTVNFKFRNKVPFDQVLHSSVKVDEYLDTSKVGENRFYYKVNDSLPVPLPDKRQPYQDMRDFITDNYVVLNYASGSNEILKANDFIDIQVSLDVLAKSESSDSTVKTTLGAIKSNKPAEPVEPTPVEPKPTPVEPKPTPVEPKPTPVEPKPTPVEPKPTPVEPKPTPVEPKPTPVEPETPFKNTTSPPDVVVTDPSTTHIPDHMPQDRDEDNTTPTEDDKNKDKYTSADSDCYGIKRSAWNLIVGFDIVLFISALVLSGLIYGVKRLKARQAHRYVMY